MPKKSSKDRAEGALDKAKGRVKEAGGSLSNYLKRDRRC
jgi:uncharacterized protein YjbJ (UPF0337 family)